MTVGIAIQLNPPIRLYTTKGPGYAHVFSQFGPESDQQWTVFLDTGEIWDMPNYRVRAQDNWSLGRSNPGLKEKIMGGDRPKCTCTEEMRLKCKAKEHPGYLRDHMQYRCCAGEKPATLPPAIKTGRVWCSLCRCDAIEDCLVRSCPCR